MMCDLLLLFLLFFLVAHQYTMVPGTLSARRGAMPTKSAPRPPWRTMARAVPRNSTRLGSTPARGVTPDNSIRIFTQSAGIDASTAAAPAHAPAQFILTCHRGCGRNEAALLYRRRMVRLQTTLFVHCNPWLAEPGLFHKFANPKGCITNDRRNTRVDRKNPFYCAEALLSWARREL